MFEQRNTRPSPDLDEAVDVFDNWCNGLGLVITHDLDGDLHFAFLRGGKAFSIRHANGPALLVGHLL